MLILQSGQQQGKVASPSGQQERLTCVLAVILAPDSTLSVCGTIGAQRLPTCLTAHRPCALGFTGGR
jgi:hypothetical protein